MGAQGGRRHVGVLLALALALGPLEPQAALRPPAGIAIAPAPPLDPVEDPEHCEDEEDTCPS